MMQVRLLTFLLAFLFLTRYEVFSKTSDPAEKVYLTTNQPFYLSGDKIEFSVIVVSYLTYKPSKTSEVLHLSLWNSNKEIIVKSRVRLEDGVGGGTVEIPENLSSGTYMLVANTTWMLNFTEKQFSKKLIKIVNPNEGAEGKDEAPFTADFYPEGGNIITAQINQIAFKTNKSDFKVKGYVVSAQSDTVSVFSSYANGYGKFNFLAADSTTYEAILEYKDKFFRFQLQKPVSDAVSLKIIDNMKDTLLVFVNVGPRYAKEYLELLIQNKGDIILGSKQKIVGSRLKFLIPKKLLGNGLNQLAILNKEGDLLSERLYYINKPGKLECTIDKSKLFFKPNEKIALPVLVKDQTSQNKSLNLSVSILNAKLFGASDLNPIHYSINLFSEVGFTAPEAKLIQLLDDPQFMDIFLMTRQIETLTLGNKNEDLASETSSFFMEKAGKLKVSGRIRDKNTNEYLSDSVVFCSVVGETTQLLASKTNSQGYFYVELAPFFGDAEVMLKLKGADGSQDNITYELEQHLPDMRKENFSNMGNKAVDSRSLENYLDFKRQDLILKRIYNTQPLTNSEAPIATINEGFFVNYTYERDFSEYITLNDFEEMARELIPGLVISRENSTSRIYLKQYDKKTNYLLDPLPNEPLIIVDGLPVFDSDLIVDINPEKVKMLRLINNRFFLNGIVFDGIFEMTTIDGEFHKSQSNHLRYVLQGFSKESEKPSDQMVRKESKLDKVPDFRSVLYWNPNLTMKTNETKVVEFEASDDVGEFLVVVKGIDEEGNLINYQTTFQIKE